MRNALQNPEVSNSENICIKSNSLFHSTTATWLLKCEKWLSLSKISVKLLESTLRMKVKLQNSYLDCRFAFYERTEICKKVEFSIQNWWEISEPLANESSVALRALAIYNLIM